MKSVQARKWVSDELTQTHLSELSKPVQFGPAADSACPKRAALIVRSSFDCSHRHVNIVAAAVQVECKPRSSIHDRVSDPGRPQPI